MNFPLWEHQKQAVSFAEAACQQLGGVLLNMDMGTGKTRTTLELAARSCPVGKILIFAPKNVLPVWEEEASKYLGHLRTLFWRRSGESVGKSADKILELNEAHNRSGDSLMICAVNYETVGSKSGAEFARRVGRLGWNIIVADEAHRLKSYKSKTSLAIGAGYFSSGWKIALTGTPMTKNFLDIFGVARFCAPQIFGSDYWNFVNTYTKKMLPHEYHPMSLILYRQSDGNYVKGSPINMEHFDTQMRRFCFTVKADDVLDLPAVRDVKIVAELPKQTMEVYKQIEEEMCLRTEAGSLVIPSEDVQVMRLQQIVAGHLPVVSPTGEQQLLNIGGKREAYRSVMQDIPDSEAVVVFCRFTADLDVVANFATGGYSELSGRINQLSEWQAGRTRILGVQIDAGGVGVDLTRAKYAVWYTLSWDSGSYLQARARLVRPGQRSSVCFVHIIGQRTVDEAIYGRVETNLRKLAAVENM